ncbi:MAG: hypothetical protein KF724_05030 [Phycisphaeraceae bacterium]|nr:hypothetical protein [Phycisphaeraceae bacterium]
MTSNDTSRASVRSLPSVERVVSVASRRRRAATALTRLFTTAAISAGAVLLLVLIARVTPALGLPPDSAWWTWLIAAAAAVPLVAAIVPLVRRSPLLDDAIEVDRRLDLRDRLSSAVSLVRDDAPFAVAAVHDGEALARDRSLPARIAKAFAVQAPRTWWVAPVVALAAFMALWLLPQFDPWSSGAATRQEIQQARDETLREVEGIVRQIEENPELAAALSEDLEMALKDLELSTPKAPEEIRREGLRKLTELANKLDDLLKDEKMQALEALKDQLASLELPSSPEAAKFAEALKRGDFGRAHEALKALQEELREGTLSEEQREALAEALEQMAEQLASSEAERSALEDALRAAGLDPDLAANPSAMQQAVENSQNLNEAQRQALREAMKSQQKASEMRRELAERMSKMSSQCKGGQDSKDGGEPGSCMSETLSQLEMQQVMRMQADAARSACRDGKASMCSGGSCSGTGSGAADGNGQGTSGGIGSGFRPEMRTATRTRVEQASGRKEGADVIAREFIEGAPIVGESHAVLRRVEVNATAVAEEGSDDDPIPPHLQSVHKQYFGTLRREIEARRRAAESAAPAPAEAAPEAR